MKIRLSSVYRTYKKVKCYEAQTPFRLGVSWCRTRVVSDTDTYNNTELYDFFKLLTVSVC